MANRQYRLGVEAGARRNCQAVSYVRHVHPPSATGGKLAQGAVVKPAGAWLAELVGLAHSIMRWEGN